MTLNTKSTNQPIYIFWSEYDIFILLNQRYKITRDEKYLILAEQKLIEIQELSKNLSDDKTVKIFTNYAKALILRYGNMKKKVKAIEILEELIEIYPSSIEFSLKLLELLFEDVLQSEDQDTINQIDELMEKISKSTLRNNPQAVFSFISQQTLLAKYSYYIKGDPSSVLDILNIAKNKLDNYQLDNLVNTLDAEIDVLEKEITKWDNLDISVRDRIKKSEFDKYIQQALKFADSSGKEIK